MEEQLAALYFLGKEIGPRLPTSAAEAKAAAYINSRLRQANMDVDLQTFRAPASSALPQGLLYAALFLSPLVYLYSPPAALALCLVALGLFIAEALSIPVLSSWLPGGESQNIIGTRPAARQSYQHLIILAHLDTSRANPLCHPRLVGAYRRIFWLILAAMEVLAVLIGLGWWLGESWLWYAQWAPAGIIAVAFVLLMQRELVMPGVAGANCNASGLSVMLRLAEELEGLQYTDLWLVATGCHETGQHGARQFFEKFPFPRDSTYVLNLDSLGQGELGIVVREGMLRSRRASAELVDLATHAEADDVTLDADPRIYALSNTDAQVAMVRGYHALSLMSFGSNRPIPANWHWSSDTVEKVEQSLLDRSSHLVANIARRLDRAAAEKATPGDRG